MRYLLDTDLISIWQWETGESSVRLVGRLSQYAADDFVFSIVSLHEQAIGAHSYIQAARTPAELKRGYRMLQDVLTTFAKAQVLAFDEGTDAIVKQLRKQGVRIGTMDLRIAATALQHDLMLLTRNTVDFSKVPGLSPEDWTTP